MSGAVVEHNWVEFHRGGLHLRDSLLWFDAPAARELCFISHAGVPQAHRHAKILTTEHTDALLRALGAAHGRGRRAHEPQSLISPYGRPFSVGQLTLELFPSGFVLGAASLLVRWQGRSVVYAGPINPREHGLAERLEARRCDLLVLPCALDAGRTALPPQAEVEQRVLRFVDESLTADRPPVLLTPPLGVAQRLIRLLAGNGFKVRLHRQIFAASRVYAAAGLLDAGHVRCHSGRAPRAAHRELLLWPPRLHASPALQRIERRRLALVSGAALARERCAELGCSDAFALSAHADHPALIDYVRASEPNLVLLVGPGAATLAEDLQALGLTARAVGPRRQLPLFD